MSRATNDAMDELHGLMAKSQAEELERALEAARQPRRVPDPEDARKTIPNPLYAPLDPRLLNAVRAFLKDNGIDAPTSSERFDPLVSKLRDLDEDEMVAARPH